MQTAIQFLRPGAHSALGNFAPGDSLRCDAALAAHFVAIGAARYLAAVTRPAAPRPVRRVSRSPVRSPVPQE